MSAEQAIERMAEVMKVKALADAAEYVGGREVQRQLRGHVLQQHPPKVAGLGGFELDENAVLRAATHVKALTRKVYKNLAHSFQQAWREDGTLRNLHKERWWKEEHPHLPPLASNTAAMMRWDPGKHDQIDDDLPAVDCLVSDNYLNWMDIHVAGCEECQRHEKAEGRATMPGQMSPQCPQVRDHDSLHHRRRRV